MSGLQKSGDWFAGANGPFCSSRCRLIDLGRWLGGGHVIFEPLHPEHFEKYAGLRRADIWICPKRNEFCKWENETNNLFFTGRWCAEFIRARATH